MHKSNFKRFLVAGLGLTLAGVLSVQGCGGRQPGGVAVPGQPGQSGQQGSTVSPNACGRIDTNDAGRRVYAFLGATAELQSQVAGLEGTVRSSCVDMGTELGMSAESMQGDTVTVCKAVSTSLRDHMKGSMKAEANVEIAYKPAVCTVNADAAAKASAQCEGSAEADVKVTCQGTCQGTCNGGCSGTCAAKNASGECAGACDGTCNGDCNGTCSGSADVQGDASCEAAAEVQANVHATCTDPVLEYKYDAKMVTDTAKLERARRAIDRGLPGLLLVHAKVKGPVSAAVATWARSTGQLYRGGKSLVQNMGATSACVLGQIGAAFEAVASIQVQVNVSVQASAEVSGAAGAQAG